MGMGINSSNLPAALPPSAAPADTAVRVTTPQTARATTAAVQNLVNVASSAAPTPSTATASAPPRIPLSGLDPDTANLLVSAVLDKATLGDVKRMVDQLKFASEKLDKTTKEKIDSFNQRSLKAIEEARKQKDSKVSGDVGFGLSVAGAVLGMIGAVLLTIFSFGGGAPAIVGAAIGLTTTLMDAADRIAKDNNLTWKEGVNKGKQAELSLGGLISAAVQEGIAGQPGFSSLPQEKQKQILSDAKTATEIVVTVMVAAGTIACGVGALKNVGTEACKLASKLPDSMIQAGRFGSTGAETLQVMSDLGSGITSLTSGAYGIQIANITFEKNQLDNKKQKFEVVERLISQEISQHQDTATQLLESLSANYDALATANASYYESARRTITAV